jgi:hypothetical protein
MRHRVAFALASVVFTVIAVAAFRVPPQKTQAEEVPVIARQLPAEGGIVPVFLQCKPASRINLNTLDGFSCTVTNNTNKTIRALSAAYSIVIESGGIESGTRDFLTLESFLHPDLHDAHVHRAIAPGDQRTLEPGGPNTFENGNPIVNRVEIAIDYVEFEDQTTLGPNEAGGKIVAALREGAAKYKDWLAQQYRANGKSVEAIVPLLERDQPIPDAIAWKSTTERNGAKIYRNHMREIYYTSGRAKLEKYLSGRDHH